MCAAVSAAGRDQARPGDAAARAAVPPHPRVTKRLHGEKTPAEMEKILAERLKAANVPAMVVTMGGDGAVYAEADGESGFCPAQKVQVKDTTGAGDAFCAGVSAGLTYGKTLGKAVEIGTRLAASVITSSENVCPRFRPEEFGIEA